MMAALNGGSTGVVTRWAMIERAPALCPQLYCVRNTGEQLMAGGIKLTELPCSDHRRTWKCKSRPKPGRSFLADLRTVSVQVETTEGQSPWGLPIIEMILTVVQANIGSSSSKCFLSTEPTKSVQAVIEVYVDHRFAEFDRSLDESGAVVRRCVTDGKCSTIDPLRITS